MQPTYEEICDVAEAAVSAFASFNLSCCLMGSLACRLYGTSRGPNDVDLVVLTRRYDQEMLKRLLVTSNPNFYLVPSKTLFATYKVLWYRLPSPLFGKPRRCKVDILIPGVLNIPDIPSHLVLTIRKLPVMPLPLLLLLKLQGWSDHRTSTRTDMNLKQFDDVMDINELLTVIKNRGGSIRGDNLSWVPSHLLALSYTRVQLYIRRYPESSKKWKDIGQDGLLRRTGSLQSEESL